RLGGTVSGPRMHTLLDTSPRTSKRFCRAASTLSRNQPRFGGAFFARVSYAKTRALRQTRSRAIASIAVRADVRPSTHVLEFANSPHGAWPSDAGQVPLEGARGHTGAPRGLCRESAEGLSREPRLSAGRRNRLQRATLDRAAVDPDPYRIDSFCRPGRAARDARPLPGRGRTRPVECDRG